MPTAKRWCRMESRTETSNKFALVVSAVIPTPLKDDISLDKTRSTRTDVALLYIARGVRGLGDGFTVILLPAYLSAIGFSPGQIGVILSASLIGTALLTLAVGFISTRDDLRIFMLFCLLLYVVI